MIALMRSATVVNDAAIEPSVRSPLLSRSSQQSFQPIQADRVLAILDMSRKPRPPTMRPLTRAVRLCRSRNNINAKE